MKGSWNSGFGGSSLDKAIWFAVWADLPAISWNYSSGFWRSGFFSLKLARASGLILAKFGY